MNYPGKLQGSNFEEQAILIKNSEVRRIEYDIERNIYRYAFEFVDIEPNEKKKTDASHLPLPEAVPQTAVIRLPRPTGSRTNGNTGLGTNI